MRFETNVFVNCPFDEDYQPVLQAILFAVIDLGFTPRIALESLDSGAVRIAKIIALVRESKFAIHDLSRLRATAAGEYYRLNMPFELGLDIGCKIYKGGKWSQKKCLVLEAEHYRYRAAISDLSGSDIAVHRNDPPLAIAAVRHWLNGEGGLNAPGPSRIWARFNEFMAFNYDMLIARGFAPNEVPTLPVPELMASIRTWIAR